MRSTPSPRNRRDPLPGGDPQRFPLPARTHFGYSCHVPWWWWKARPSDPVSYTHLDVYKRQGERGRDRGDRRVSEAGRLQRGSPLGWTGKPAGSGAGTDRSPGRRALHGAGGIAGRNAGGGNAVAYYPLGYSQGSGRAATWPSRGRSASKRPGPATSAPDYFPAALRAFPSRNKIAGLRRPPLRSGPLASLRVQVRTACWLSSPEGREGRGHTDEGASR